jgi:hypothetical protein
MLSNDTPLANTCVDSHMAATNIAWPIWLSEIGCNILRNIDYFVSTVHVATSGPLQHSRAFQHVYISSLRTFSSLFLEPTDPTIPLPSTTMLFLWLLAVPIGISATVIKRLGKTTLVYPCTGDRFGDMSGKSSETPKRTLQELTVCEEFCNNMCYGMAPAGLLRSNRDQS